MLAYHVDAPIAWLTLDRPEKLNAMTRGFWAELRDALDGAERDRDVRVAIFRGAGEAFSVGGDMDSFGQLGDTADRRAYMREALGALRAVEAFPKPTIAAVHGHALGGGCELTMVCDIVVADETARFGTPESKVGMVPGLGLVRGLANVNLHWMKYLIFTGHLLDAREAQLAGLVNKVAAAGQHVALAAELASDIARRAPVALAVGKQMLSRHADEGYGHAVEAIALLQGSDDLQEGLAAFRERREPRFQGR